MFVGTTEAACLLNISAQRVRVLLKEGRIQGARKINGRTWGIPLYEGRPRISGKKRGPEPNWSQKRHCGQNTLHFNRPNIDKNRKLKKIDPEAEDDYVLSAQRGSKILAKGHEVEINGPCRIV
ncbi:MAG: DNA-binding protein, partial [Okeania sp. SIO3I5]|uniref:DNA-binding protein n=1 Tax=Okeania sp. SIO3I5 TaxID=2607805 RepID=UPI0013B84BF3